MGTETCILDTLVSSFSMFNQFSYSFGILFHVNDPRISVKHISFNTQHKFIIQYQAFTL